MTSKIKARGDCEAGFIMNTRENVCGHIRRSRKKSMVGMKITAHDLFFSEDVLTSGMMRLTIQSITINKELL
jgi:hypothetical protein